MTKKRIAIDVDDVIAKTMEHFLDHLNSTSNYDFDYNDFENYNLKKVRSDVDFDINQELISYVRSNLALFEVYEDSKEIILDLSKEFELLVITSRSSVVKSATQEWIASHFPDGTFTGIYFLEDSSFDCKSEFCKEHNCIFLLEDAPHYADATRNKGIYVLLFSRPWNQYIEECDNLFRVKNWSEAREKIIELSQDAH